MGIAKSPFKSLSIINHPKSCVTSETYFKKLKYLNLDEHNIMPLDKISVRMLKIPPTSFKKKDFEIIYFGDFLVKIFCISIEVNRSFIYPVNKRSPYYNYAS